jgi:RNA polymerase sigma factor (TIGR02999 family)
MAGLPHVTQLLKAWQQGDEHAFDELMPLVYAELRQIARLHMRREKPGTTLQTTALANEAYVRLIDARQVKWRDRAHFFAMASRVMRRVLVDAARARHAAKRGGTSPRVTFDESLGVVAEQGVELAAIDDALAALEEVSERKARVVELRFFGGLTVEETAAVLKVSADTVERDWRFARAWLKRELSERPA